ncbi:MAG: LptF/LptG family permease [Campylobacterota bacterium]|nr:LptF/LptG family permease [Campylobacterota bacterium]
MGKLRSYILRNFTISFFSIFLPLFAIASVIFLIKLATYTAVVQLTIMDMSKLYLFVLPEILFYTLPVSFFISATLSLYKLSNDDEMVVIFALGIKPAFIYRTFLTPALILTTLLSFNFFVMFPHATVLSTNFLIHKKSEAKFNIGASEYGHKFGNWLLFIGKDDNKKSFEDILLFNKDATKEMIIASKKGKVFNDNGELKFRLYDGNGYSYADEELTKINFEQMQINDMMRSNLRQYRDTLDFWLSKERRDNKIKMFITDTLLSLFPVISIFMIMALGVLHVRHKKNYIYGYLFLTILFYYGATLGLQGVLSFYTIPAVLFSSLLISYIFYKKNVLKRF